MEEGILLEFRASQEMEYYKTKLLREFIHKFRLVPEERIYIRGNTLANDMCVHLVVEENKKFVNIQNSPANRKSKRISDIACPYYFISHIFLSLRN